MNSADTIQDHLAAALTTSAKAQFRKWAAAIWDGVDPSRAEFGENLAAAMLVAFLEGLGVSRRAIYAEAEGPLFVEALDALRRKNVVLGVQSPREVDEKLLQTAFFVSGVTSENMVEQIRQELLKTRETGEGRDAFIAATDKIVQLAGDHLDVVWRTNLASAANAGRWAQYHAPAAQGLYVAYEWRSLRVPGTRPLHRAMHRFIAPADDPIWKVCWPPSGFRCLCSVLPLTAERAKSAGFEGRRMFQSELQQDVVIAAEHNMAITVEGKPTYFPDPGFRGNSLIA